MSDTPMVWISDGEHWLNAQRIESITPAALHANSRTVTMFSGAVWTSLGTPDELWEQMQEALNGPDMAEWPEVDRPPRFPAPGRPLDD